MQTFASILTRQQGTNLTFSNEILFPNETIGWICRKFSYFYSCLLVFVAVRAPQFLFFELSYKRTPLFLEIEKKIPSLRGENLPTIIYLDEFYNLQKF